jgi:hypothetical protein
MRRTQILPPYAAGALHVAQGSHIHGFHAKLSHVSVGVGLLGRRAARPSRDAFLMSNESCKRVQCYQRSKGLR